MSDGFGAYVRHLRGQVTRKSVAAKAGISAEYLRLIESENRVPQKDKQLALAVALQTPLRPFLERALAAENARAHRILTRASAVYPGLRRVLIRRLCGPGRDVVNKDIQGLSLSPHERTATLLWASAMLMDGQGVAAAPAVSRAREECVRPEYVEGPVAEYVARNLVSWNVDHETSRQTHWAASRRIDDLLMAAAAALGVAFTATGLDDGMTGGAPHGELAGLMTDSEFADLFTSLKGYRQLADSERRDIRRLWELAGRMVNDRLGFPDPA